MIAQLKQQFKSIPFLYKLWFFGYRKRGGARIKWFDIDPVLYLDGYPRSGNTFSVHLIRSLWPELPFVHHFHVKATLKIALKKKLPIFILLRDPANAVTSNYLRYFAMRSKDLEETDRIDEQKLNELTKAYLDYYSFVNEHRQAIRVINFRELIDKPFGMIRAINATLPEAYAVADEEELAARTREINKTDFGAKGTFQASLPNAKKEAAKKQLKEILKNSPYYEPARAVYQQLSASTVT